MKSGKMAAIVRLIILCLTICQFTAAHAQTEDFTTETEPAPRKAKRKRGKSPKSAQDGYVLAGLATPSYRADELEIEFATAERSDMGRLNEQSQWLRADQSVLDPIPRERMLISTTSLAGSTSSFETAPTGTTRAATSSTTTQFGPVLKLSYGLSDISYVSASLAFLPGSTSFSTRGAGPAGNSQTEQLNEGWREPKIAVGASLRIRRQTRVTAELGGTIPLGSGHSEDSGNKVTSNGLSGGGSLIPRLALVSKVGGVKFVGNAAYTHFFDRHVDWIKNGIQTNRTISGGNLLDTSLGLEIPSAWNLGLAGIYQNEASSTTSFFTTTTATSISGSGVQRGGGKIYMGIPISETDIVILPAVTYLSVLNEQVDNLPVTRSEDWKFVLQGIIHF